MYLRTKFVDGNKICGVNQKIRTNAVNYVHLNVNRAFKLDLAS